MTDPLARPIGLLVAAAVVLVSGVRLTRAGSPYGALALNLHKLVSVAVLVYIGSLVVRAHEASPLSGFQWTVIGTAAALVLAVIVTGGIVTAMRPAPAWALWVHRGVSWLAGVLVAVGLLVTAGCASPAQDEGRRATADPLASFADELDALLYLKAPDSGLPLILLANSEGVWWDNPLDSAHVERSPFAMAFMRCFL